MNKNSKIYVAGHRGLVGSAIIRKLQKEGFTNLVFRTSKELDLRRQAEVETFFEKEKPDYVFLAAAKVGGIMANSIFVADFIYDNIMIATNIINSSYKYGVKKLLNLGSSCIYPKLAPQPLKEDYLLTSELEPTNEPYAIAKISAIKLCRYYNQQYKTNFISLMPTNLFGPKDNFNLVTSHVLPALIRKLHLAKLLQEDNDSLLMKDIEIFGLKSQQENISLEETKKILEDEYGLTKNNVTLWGTGNPKREFLFVDDLAESAFFLMQNYNYSDIGEFINIGTGQDILIKDLAYLIKTTVGFKGEIYFDSSKPDGTPQKLLDVSRINKLGWSAKRDLKQGIEEVYKWYLSVLTSK